MSGPPSRLKFTWEKFETLLNIENIWPPPRGRTPPSKNFWLLPCKDSFLAYLKILVRDRKKFQPPRKISSYAPAMSFIFSTWGFKRRQIAPAEYRTRLYVCYSFQVLKFLTTAPSTHFRKPLNLRNFHTNIWDFEISLKYF